MPASCCNFTGSNVLHIKRSAKIEVDLCTIFLNFQSTPKSNGFVNSTGYQPTLMDISEAMGLRQSGIHKHIRNLITKGYLLEAEGKAAFQLPESDEQYSDSKTTLPLVGVIAAGAPIEAIPEMKAIDLAAHFCGPDRYVLKISGNSMIEAGIFNGDYVVVQKQSTANRGDIVVALIDRLEATLKYFHPRPVDVIELRPANETLEPMFYPANQVEVQGVVIGSFRGYQVSF